jgi:hypothetical protein
MPIGAGWLLHILESLAPRLQPIVIVVEFAFISG